MKTIIDILLVAVVTIYIVDLSGFTESWRSALARLLKISESALRPIKPFDCGKCMTWWVCLIYIICVGKVTLPYIAFIALLSHMSQPIGQALVLCREVINVLVDKLLEKI